jgi:hypothetical protein
MAGIRISALLPFPVAASSGRSRRTRSRFLQRVSIVMSFSPDSCMPFSTTKYLTMPTFLFSSAIPSKDRPFEVAISVKLLEESLDLPLTRTDLMGQHQSSTNHFRSSRLPPSAAHCNRHEQQRKKRRKKQNRPKVSLAYHRGHNQAPTHMNRITVVVFQTNVDSLDGGKTQLAQRRTYNSSPLTFANAVTTFTFPVACSATALSWSPSKSARRKFVHKKSHAAQTLRNDSFLMLYVSGHILAGQGLEQLALEHTATPQFRQWHARRKTANFALQM